MEATQGNKNVKIYRTNKTGTFECGPYKCAKTSDAIKMAISQYGNDWSYRTDLIERKS